MRSDETEPAPPEPPPVPQQRESWTDPIVAALTMRWQPPPGVDKHDPENNSGTNGPVPPDVARSGWCWGAMGLGPIWALWNGLAWLAMIEVMIPIVGIPMMIYAGYAGHGLAWQNRRFRDRETFFATMRTWDIWGVVGLVLYAGLFVWLRFCDR